MKITILTLLTIYTLFSVLNSQMTTVDPQYVTVGHPPAQFCSTFTDNLSVHVDMESFIDTFSSSDSAEDIFGSTLLIELSVSNLGLLGSGQEWSFEGNAPLVNSPNLAFWYSVNTPVTSAGDTWDFVLAKGSSQGFKYLFHNIGFSIKITGESGAIYQVNASINPSSTAITIENYSFEPDDGLSKGCLNLTFRHSCDQLADNSQIILASDSFNSANQTFLNLFNTNVSSRCTGNVKANTDIDDVFCSFNDEKFFINSLFKNTVNVTTVELRMCNVVTLPHGQSRTVTINLTGAQLGDNPVYATGSIAVDNQDQQQLSLVGTELANPFVGEAFEFTVEMRSFWNLIIEEDVILTVRFPTQLSSISRADFEITNNSNNVVTTFSNKRVRNRKANLRLRLSSVDYLDLGQGFKVKVSGFTWQAQQGTFPMEYRLKVRSTKVKLMENTLVDFTILNSSAESADIIPFNKTFDAVTSSLVVLELPPTANLNNSSSYDVKLSLRNGIIATNGLFGGVDALKGISFSSFTVDDASNTVTISGAQFSNFPSSNKIIFRLKSLRNNTNNYKENPADIEIYQNTSLVYSSTALVDLDRIIPNILNAQLIYGINQTEVKVDFKYSNINLNSALLRLNLSSEFGIAYESNCISNVTLWSPADVLYCREGASASADRQNLGLTNTTLNTFPDTDIYSIQFPVTLASEMLKSQTIKLDFVKEGPFLDLSNTDVISAETLPFTFTLDCVANCVKCDTTGSPVFSCSECETNYTLQTDGTCQWSGSNKMALIPPLLPRNKPVKRENILETKSDDNGMDNPWDGAASFATKNLEMVILLASASLTLLSSVILDGCVTSTLSSLVLNYTFLAFAIEMASSLPTKTGIVNQEGTLLNIVILLFNTLVSLTFFLKLKTSIGSYSLLHLLFTMILPGHLFIFSCKKGNRVQEKMAQWQFLGNGALMIANLTFHVTNQLLPLNPTRILHAFALLLTYSLFLNLQFKSKEKEQDQSN